MSASFPLSAAPDGRLMDLLDRLSVRMRRPGPDGLPPNGLRALRRLADAGRRGSGQGELARALALSPAAASRLCDSLEAAGLARRDDHPLDRRRKTLRLTEKGRAAVEGHDDGMAALAGLSPAERERLAELLARLDARRTPPARPFPDGRRRIGHD